MNGIINPVDTKISGTTNVNGITWIQRGNVVEVTCRNASFAAATIYNITGLPTPLSSSILHNIMSNTGMSMDGFIQKSNDGWRAYCTVASNDNYCHFTYLTDS